ncbi:UDP-glucosyltransferase 29-like [Hordeum vulgare subsp. vulgare]|uniref:Glycosyltransferase n=1 Tax=Hordeum vulgare subsp. vulgare TaxID=112509 RepID=A0A8I6WRI3_HORVV|nr:UDP-glucosyltransferase 29-like [Hordeum vulgare subsp. vulgare]
MAQAESESMRVVMFPWLAHGHINPYLELAKRLIANASDDHHLDVVVHLVSTPANLAPLAHHQTDRLRLVELHLPSLPDLPPALHTTKGLPARLMPVLKRACDLAAPRFGALLDELCPDILVYDFIQPWAPLEAEARGVPAFHFATCGAAATAFFIHCLKTDRPPSAFPFESISLGGVDEDAKYTALVTVREDSTALVAERDRLPLSLERSSGFVAVKSSADIERKYMEYLSQLLGKEIIPTGPLLVDSGGSEEQRDGGRIMRWLDGEEPGSVVFVSFGSEYFMSEHQMAQMARGLELSGVPFLWVVRFPNAEDDARGAARSMPPGFEPELGLVVEGWAPQRRILSHPSCGAFLTHCGWSSVLESMAAGVPMVALPLHIDQPLNANLAVELGAAAARLKQERFGEFTAEEVARAVRAAVKGKEGEAARRRARELQEVVARNNGDDGQIATLLQRMARLCGKGQAVPN